MAFSLGYWVWAFLAAPEPVPERLIAQAAYRGSDIFECDRAAKRIKEGDFESFHNEWHELGRETEEAGRTALAAGGSGDILAGIAGTLRAVCRSPPRRCHCS
jgi:hypothetical protein